MYSKRRSSQNTVDGKYKKLEKELEATKAQVKRQERVISYIANQLGTNLPDELVDLVETWEPPSRGSRHSPMEEEHHTQIPSPEHMGIEKECTPPEKLVCFLPYVINISFLTLTRTLIKLILHIYF